MSIEANDSIKTMLTEMRYMQDKWTLKQDHEETIFVYLDYQRTVKGTQ